MNKYRFLLYQEAEDCIPMKRIIIDASCLENAWKLFCENHHTKMITAQKIACHVIEKSELEKALDLLEEAVKKLNYANEKEFYIGAQYDLAEMVDYNVKNIRIRIKETRELC